MTSARALHVLAMSWSTQSRNALWVGVCVKKAACLINSRGNFPKSSTLSPRQRTPLWQQKGGGRLWQFLSAPEWRSLVQIESIFAVHTYGNRCLVCQQCLLRLMTLLILLPAFVARADVFRLVSSFCQRMSGPLKPPPFSDGPTTPNPHSPTLPKRG